MTEEPFVIIDQDKRMWHIPDAGGRPLCGAAIGAPERRYLPRAMAPDETACSNCQRLHELPEPGRERVLGKLATLRPAAGELRKVEIKPGDGGQDVVLHFNGMIIDVWIKDAGQ